MAEPCPFIICARAADGAADSAIFELRTGVAHGGGRAVGRGNKSSLGTASTVLQSVDCGTGLGGSEVASVLWGDVGVGAVEGGIGLTEKTGAADDGVRSVGHS